MSVDGDRCSCDSPLTRLVPGSHCPIHGTPETRDELERLRSEVKRLRKPAAGESVVQAWVAELPLREQGTLMTGVRGCDLVPKLPLDSTERVLVGFLRFLILVPADHREVGITGAFYQHSPPEGWKPSELGHYPQHWYAHLMHAYEVCGYRHPDPDLKCEALEVYGALVRGLHLNVETKAEMIERLSEDRIASGEVVS